MKKSSLKGTTFATTLALAGIVATATGAYAAVQQVTGTIAFDNAITITKNSDINFGIVLANTADSYTITTAGVVSAAGGATHLIGGTTAAGNLTIKGSATQTISIQTGGYTAASGVTPSAATCSYGGAAAVACDTAQTGLAAPTAAGTTLLLGLTVAADGTQAAGSTAAPTFNVTVIYG